MCPDGQAYTSAPGFGNPLTYVGTALAAVGVSVSPTGSPFLYALPCTGKLYVSGGTVSAVAVIDASGATVTVASATGVQVDGSSRWKGIQITYTAAPTLTFVPF